MSAAQLAQLAAKLGMRISTRWEGSKADQAAYARKHGGETSRMFMGDDSDIQIASRVRMLMRDDMDHEAVVCAARDRICALWVENDALFKALENLVDQCDDVFAKPAENDDLIAAKAALKLASAVSVKRVAA